MSFILIHSFLCYFDRLLCRKRLICIG